MYKHVIQPPQVKNLGYTSPSNIMLTQYFYFSNSCKKRVMLSYFFGVCWMKKIDWCMMMHKKSSVSWSYTHVSMGAPKEQERRTNQRASVGYWPKTLWKLSHKRAPTMLESMSFREIVHTFVKEGFGSYIVV